MGHVVPYPDNLFAPGNRHLVTAGGALENQAIGPPVSEVEMGHMSRDWPAILEKLEIVDELKENGHRVCVIGDGVNDAPALAAAHVSMAPASASSRRSAWTSERISRRSKRCACPRSASPARSRRW